MRRIVSFFTALSMTLMLFTSMPTGVSAEEVQIGYSLNAQRDSHSHPACGQTCTHDGTDIHGAESYTALTQASFTGGENGEPADNSGVELSLMKSSYLLSEGNYYLAEDITVDKEIRIDYMSSDSPIANLCLNGHMLTSTVTGNNSSIFLGKVTFNLCDCKSGGSIQSQARFLLDIHSKNLSFANLYGGTLTSVNKCVIAYNSLTLDGAVLKSEKEYSIDAQVGSSVNIKNGSAESGGSSSVRVFTTDFIMTGGQILHTGDYEAALDFARDSSGNISGGTIKSDKGYGISLGSIPLTLSGSPVINGKDADIAFVYDGLVTVSNDLNGTYSVLQRNWWVSDGPNSKYEITENNPFTFTTPADADHSDHFTASAKMTGVAVRNSGTGSNQQVQLYLHTHTGGTATCKEKAVCEICGEEYGKFAAHTPAKSEAVDPTCTADGNEAYWTCSVCNKMFSDKDGKTEITQIPTIPAAGHKYAEDWKSDSDEHWHECTVCHDKKDTGSHTWDEGEETTPPTETTEGVMTYKCTLCGEEKTEPIESLGHTHSLAKTERVEATCTVDGSKEYWSCSGCGKKFSDENGTNEITEAEVIPAVGHSWDDGKITTQPTETVEGVKTFTCTVCGTERTENIGTLEHTHTYSTEWTSDDNFHWHAAICGHSGEVSEKALHSFAEGKCTVCQKADPNYTQPTEPTVTDPPVTEPSDTEPTVTEPPVTDPTVTEPTVTEPTVTEPTVTEPPVTEPSVTEPIVTLPPVTEPPVTKPIVTEPPVTEPVVTAPSYVPSFPSNGVPAPVVPISRQPYLQDENGKIGWEVISDDIWETPDGETVLVNMNGTTELPKNIVSDISGRDIDLVLIMNGGFVWRINGMSVTKAKTVNMSVRKLSKIPESTVNNFFGDSETVQLDLRHSGDFGFIAELTVYLGSRFSGMYANSYCYKARNFEFGDSSEIVDGTAVLRFTHASSWLIVMEDFSALEDVSSGAAAHSAGDPIDMSNSVSGISIPDFTEERKLKLSNKKRRYRILKKRRLDDMVFVL